MNINKEQNFHEFALQSGLFKGQANIYFCYLKSEKLSFAIAKIVSASGDRADHVLKRLQEKSALLPSLQAQSAAGIIPKEHILAQTFEILALIRLAVFNALIADQNGRILCQEYELVARKTTEAVPVSYLSIQDLTVPEMPSPSARASDPAIFIGHKGQDIKVIKDNKGQNDRQEAILKIINENKRVSIKDLSKVVKDCSEKTIQRELAVLIEQGLVSKEGKKRWSIYLPVA